MCDAPMNQSLIQADLVNKESLCSKYDISIDKLDFEYVGGCKNVKELERIVKILRSGEEGHFPDLQSHAEERLRSLAPNSRVLRVEEPALKTDSLLPDERDLVNNDIQMWINDMSSKDVKLTDWNKNYPSDLSSGDNIPPIRKALLKKVDKAVTKVDQSCTKSKKPVISDYASWDKYDPDTELLKMDADEERKKMELEIEERRKKANAAIENKKAEGGRLETLVKMSETMSDTEKTVHANLEKERGNEYYRVCDYDTAVEYYSTSIAICPTAVAYCNRAACYLKQGKYDLALKDVNKCLELDPDNTKGLYRRGLCLQHKNKFDEALRDMQAVLRREPNNLLVQHVANELRQECRSTPRSVRMLVQESEDDKVVELSESEARGIKAGYEVNEWGLARSVCNCYSRPQFLHTLNRNAIADHLIYKPKEDNIEILNGQTVDYNDEIKPKPANENLISEIICNGHSSDERMELNRIPFTRNNNNNNNNINDEDEDEDLIPKKIKIIETVKPVTTNSHVNIKEQDKAVKCIVKDMRGQKQPHGQKNESEMTEQFSNITIEESGSAIPITENPSSKQKEPPRNQKQNQNSNQESNNQTQSNRFQQDRGYDFSTNFGFEKQSVIVASKYTQKVASAKNMNAKNESSFDDRRNINNLNININSNSTDNNLNESITPFTFPRLWSDIKETNNYTEYAGILRRVPPSRLCTVLSNKLDDKMLDTMLKALSNGFDSTNPVEADLVKEYLVALTKVERFCINVQFLDSDIKQITSCLIDKVGGGDISSLKKVYNL